MTTAFIPSTDTAATGDEIVANNGWYPDLAPADFRAQTGMGEVFGLERIAAAIQVAMIEVNASIAAWQATQSADTLAEVPAPQYGAVSEKVILYTQAVFSRARAEMLRTTRDYDATKDGHDRADKLEATAEDYQRQSNEALARLTGRGRMVVELI